tara:strand:+ start:4406 stop:4666 length:261 start_codon:yes stop_codon:yes gene_type:complete
MNPSKFQDNSTNRTRARVILDRLHRQGETPHKELREQVIQDYLDKYIESDVDHMDVTRWGMVDQLWSLHAEGKIYRDISKGTWDLC